jgi:hypothetical protein
MRVLFKDAAENWAMSADVRCGSVAPFVVSALRNDPRQWSRYE